ncbi:hypothetical protein SY86_20855 [Erwinia tracheiphila]|uniref:Uncharacterized protein n=1 Tax=Erwinia tracheiphila TaxID=65700 RepID=A0A0M2KJ01_9GAMM|nr:hypothetical protein SY86_20855 [Erwinia tracheiphila]
MRVLSDNENREDMAFSRQNSGVYVVKLYTKKEKKIVCKITLNSQCIVYYTYLFFLKADNVLHCPLKVNRSKFGLSSSGKNA